MQVEEEFDPVAQQEYKDALNENYNNLFNRKLRALVH